APAPAASSRDDSGCLPPKTNPRFRGPGRRQISGRFRVSATQNQPEISGTAGDHTRFPLTGARLDFTPPQPIPLYLAARGPRMMSLAGELADGLITHSLSLPFIEHVVERVELGAQRAQAATADTAAPRQPSDCSIAVWLEIFLHDDLAHARDVLRPRCRYMVGGEFDPSMIPLYGLDPAAVMKVRQAVRANDPKAHELITDDMVDAFSICGSVDRAGDRIDALRSAGVSEVILSFGPAISEHEIAEVGEAMLSFLNR
ncbi:MAG: LLM class flavin-dependent oxidoreductase, partial [Acidimicrobiaceae bacterium]|nr:LLM class flavin-dependent oxidoreductase [Acidimicrobiaceae bacterium]